MKATQLSTPGPWEVDGDTIKGPRGNTIAECCGYSVKAEDPAQKAQGGREANAKLIAAAPELAQALKAIIAALTQPVQTSGNQDPATCAILRADAAFAVKTAQAALAKAE